MDNTTREKHCAGTSEALPGKPPPRRAFAMLPRRVAGRLSAKGGPGPS